MEFVCNWLRIDSKELKTYENIIQKKKCAVSQHKPPRLDLCKSHSTRKLKTIKFHEKICLFHHIYSPFYNIYPQGYNI